MGDLLSVRPSFVLLAFADLKRHTFHYHVLHPAVYHAASAARLVSCTPMLAAAAAAADDRRALLEAARTVLGRDGRSFAALARAAGGGWREARRLDEEAVEVVLADASSHGAVLSWNARLLAYLLPAGRHVINVIRGPPVETTCLCMTIDNDRGAGAAHQTGWEASEGGAVGRTVDLSAMMDSKQYARPASHAASLTRCTRCAKAGAGCGRAQLEADQVAPPAAPRSRRLCLVPGAPPWCWHARMQRDAPPPRMCASLCVPLCACLYRRIPPPDAPHRTS